MNAAAMRDPAKSRTDAERLAAAEAMVAGSLTRPAALQLDACIHCGRCADACPFHLASGDARLAPVAKLDPLRRLAARGLCFAELETWAPQVYDACTMCGRCTLACPMGIDTAALIGVARRALFAAGLAPEGLAAAAERAHRDGSPLGVTPSRLRERLDWIAEEHEVAIPVDAPRAGILLTLSSIEVMKYPESVAAMARILARSPDPWTISTAGYEATNFGMLAGAVEWQREATMKIVGAAKACGASLVLVPECGHAYSALRWQGAAMAGGDLPFRVLHFAEYLEERLAAGTLPMRKSAGTVAFHDPCQVSRRGGATAAPRAILAALGFETREPEDAGDLGACCGGGGGVSANPRADALRYRVTAIRIRQLEAPAAHRIVTSCANCRQSFDDEAAHAGHERQVGSLVELAAAHLVPDAGA